MPRRPAEVLEKVPLFLIPAAIKKKIKTTGEELVRVVVKKASRHFYNISIHSWSVSRELWAEAVWAGKPGQRMVGT
jgi:hypothetical protein